MNDEALNAADRNKAMVELWSIDEVPLQQVHAWIHEYSHSRVWGEFLHWRAALGMPERIRTIEVGCGYGKFSMLLGLSGEHVTLLDYNAAALESAVQCHGVVGLSPTAISGDLMQLSYDMEGQFDLACSFGTLEHFAGDDRRRAFEANARLLKPDGLMFFTVPNRHASFYRIAWGLRKKIGLVPTHFYEEPYSSSELRQIAVNAGVETLWIAGTNTMREDFDFWILENLKSAGRKLTRRRRPSDAPPEDLDLESLDISAAHISLSTNCLDRRYSSPLLYVGRKPSRAT